MNHLKIAKVFAFTLVLVSAKATLAVDTYPLTCKFTGADSASWQQVSNGVVVAGIGFRQSDKPASAGVPEGYCAWADRGMNPSEPTIIAQELPSLMQIFEVTFKGMPGLVSAPAAWVAMTKVRGTQITFKVHTASVIGTAVPVLKIE